MNVYLNNLFVSILYLFIFDFIIYLLNIIVIQFNYDISILFWLTRACHNYKITLNYDRVLVKIRTTFIFVQTEKNNNYYDFKTMMELGIETIGVYKSLFLINVIYNNFESLSLFEPPLYDQSIKSEI